MTRPAAGDPSAPMETTSAGTGRSALSRALVLGYGLVSYVVFLGTFLYAIGFVGNLLVPKSIDSGGGGAFWPSVLMNVGLMGVFGLQHSVMARPGFKRWWTQFVPRPVERSTYVLFASLALMLLFALWRPMPTVVWSLEGDAARGVAWTFFGLGWGLVLVSTFMISHAHLFGLKQVHDHARRHRPSEPGFQTPGLYRHVRHPIMLGFLIAFWAAPDMTTGHLLFAAVTSAYILVGVRLEELDLAKAFGERYRDYQSRVPPFLPSLRSRSRGVARAGSGTADGVGSR
jgi:methanethiol S-methyltransferase